MIKQIISYFRREVQATIEYCQERSSNVSDDIITPAPGPIQKAVPASALYPQAQAEDTAKTLEERQAEDAAWRAEEEMRLNAAYDFNSISGVNSIPVPCREVNSSTTGRVEYYLRGTCFFKHWDSGNTELALACLRKAQELMYVSDMLWRRNDFLRLVCYLYKVGKNEDAEKELERIDSFFAEQGSQQDNMLKTKVLAYAKDCKTDLVEATSLTPYCGECAKYINRVFSISGDDKRFPPLPEEFFSGDSEHHLSCLSIWPFIYGKSKMHIGRKDIIKYSNRPYIDERTPEEIEQYSANCARILKKTEFEARQGERMIENAKLYREDMQTLKWLNENLPKLCPKTLSGFRRMRTMNSKNYQKLVIEAEKLGKRI